MSNMNRWCVQCGHVFLRKGATNDPQSMPIVCKKCLLKMYQSGAY